MKNPFTRLICLTVGHTWDRIMVRTPEGTKTIGYQCYHCGVFHNYRPAGVLDRYFE